MKKILFGLLFALFVFLPNHVLAQSNIDDGLNLVTSPLPINLVAEPGSTVSAQIKVKNGGNHSEKLQVGLMKFSAFGEEGKPKLMDRENGDGFFDWLKFSENIFDVAPNEWKTITLTINVPKDAAFGYYYAVTFSRKEEQSPDGPRSTKIVGATACLVLLEARVPNAIRNIEVLDFSTDKRVFEYLPTKFTIKLQNKGNVHVSPRGNIFINNMSGKKVGLLEVNDIKGNVLPDSNRIFDAQWTDGFPFYNQSIDETGKKILLDKKGREISKLKWDLGQIQKFRIGKYSASLMLVYDDGSRDVPIEARVTFWIIPWRILLVLSVIVFANVFFMGWVIWFIRQNMVSNKRRRRNV